MPEEVWECQGCGCVVETDYAYEHKSECYAYQRSLVEGPSDFYDDYTDDDFDDEEN